MQVQQALSQQFFSRDSRFWLYHVCGCLLVMAAYFAQHSYYGQPLLRLTLINLLGMVLFTFTALCFRFLFKKFQWQAFYTVKLISLVFCYSVIAGVFVAVTLTWLTKPYYLDIQLAQASGSDTWNIVFNQLMYLTFTYQVIACGWGFIYNYTVENRRAQQTLVNNLALQNSLKEAQLAGLSNQLNPHFLFNSLNNIRFVIHENQQKADDMLTNLSELLRYSLEINTHEKVTLAQELTVIHQFIDLQSIQLEHRLQFELHCDQNIKHFLLPPMTIQLLIENAIKHGIEQLPEGGCLQVELRESAEHLLCRVINDKPEKYNELTAGANIGLKNISQRLALLYGEAATLTIEEQPCLFDVSLSLPKEVAL